MGLVLHRGAPGGAADRAAVGAWRQAGGLLVARDRDAARRLELAELAAAAVVLDRRVATLGGLRSQVRRAAGMRAVEPPAELALRLALVEALAARITWPGFGASAEGPGFPAVAARAILELRSGRVAPPELAAAGRGDAVIADLAELARALPHGLAHADLAWEAADAAGRLSAFPPVAVVGFDDLAPADWALLCELGRVTDVAVALAYRPGRAAYRARDGRQARWAAEAEAVHDHAPDDDGRPEGLRALEEGLFEDVPPAGGAGDVVRFVEAAGTAGMYRAALEAALAAERAGTPVGEIALVVPRLARDRALLDRLLADWSIPARRSTRVRVLETPLGLALAQLLELAPHLEDPAAPEAFDVFVSWLRSAYSGCPADAVDELERALGRADPARRGELVARARPALEPARVLAAFATAGLRRQLAAIGEVARGLLQTAASVPPGPADRLDDRALAALEGLARALEEDDEAPDPQELGPRPPVPAGPVGLLLADLTVADEVGPPQGLTVTDYAGLRGRRFRLVVLTGLDAEGIPGRPAADPLLAPVRAVLGERLPPRARGTDEERLRFLQAVAAAGERLVLVRRAIDDDGRELAPSPYWMEALRLAGRRPEWADLRAGAGGEIAADPAAAATEREALRALAAAGRSAPGDLADALARRRRPLGLPSRPFAGLRSFSVTDLEAYLRCAYGWLHDRVIAPQELRAAFDARAEGEFGHTVLRRLFERVEGPCTSDRLERFTTALTEVLDEVAEEAAHPGAGRVFGAFVRRTGIHLAALLAREAASEPRFKPTGFEQRLREEGLVADAVVTGRADRIDLAPDGRYAVAIDYKRSRASYDPDAEEAHQRLQLPLYAEVAARAVGAESAGGLYVAIAKEDVGGRLRADVAAYGTPPAPLVPAAEWREIVAEAVRDAERAVQGIRAGDLGEPDACGSPWCGHAVLWR